VHGVPYAAARPRSVLLPLRAIVVPVTRQGTPAEAAPPVTAEAEALAPRGGPGIPAVSPVSGSRAAPAARPVQDMLPSLQRYLPHTLYEPMERRATAADLAVARDHLAVVLNTAKTYLPDRWSRPPAAWGGSRRPVPGHIPVRRCVGLYPLSERLKAFPDGAERITAVINGLFNELVAVLHAHGGTLLKFGGDALLGLFGEQSAASADGMADGALLAVQAALAMQAIMGRFAAVEAAGQPHALRVKCGVSSGRYFAAHLGTPHPPQGSGKHGVCHHRPHGQRRRPG